MVRLRGRSSRARGARRGVAGRAAAGRGAVGRGRVAHGSRGPGRRARGGSFSAPLMGRPRPPALQPMGYGEPDYGYAGPRMPPMMPPLIPGPRALRPYPPPAPHLAGPFLRARPFPNEYPMRHPMGMPQLPPRPMLPPVPPVPPFIRGRGGFRGGLAKTGKAFNNGALNKGKTNKKKSAKAKRNEEAEINKPWVNNALKVEIQKKHRLFEEANRKQSDTVCWKAYNEQKAFVTSLVNRAKLDYIGSHSEEEVSKIPELKSLLEAKKNENKTSTEVAATA